MSIHPMTENGLTLKKNARTRQYPTKIITYTDYIVHIVLLANTPV